MKFSSNYEFIKFSFESSGIANLQMIDKAGKNGLTPDFVESLIHHLDAIKANDKIKVLVISGLPEIFCSGADLETLEKLCKKEIKPV